MTTRKINYMALFIFALFILAGSLLLEVNSSTRTPSVRPASTGVEFDGQRALADVERQLLLGPRTPGSLAHAQFREWAEGELEVAGWQVETQTTSRLGHPIYNIIASRSAGQPKVIIGAHYDSRLYADHDLDPAKHQQPVPGANDGASGVAVLLELARTLPKDNHTVWLVFFDAEDNGNIPTWDWILGSRAFVEEYFPAPEAVIIIDMIGDADLNIYQEKNSDPQLTAEIWTCAAELGYAEYFIPEEKFSMLDDHTPFLEASIPAIDIIDFDYPYWHTTADTTDKVSGKSLKVVGDTLLAWLKSRH